MSSNLINKLNGMDISDMKLKEMIQNKEWKDVIKKIEVIIAEMNPDMLSYCQDKISNIYDKYLNIEGEPNYEEAAKILKNEMERDNGPTWICMIGKNSHSILNHRKKLAYIAI